MSSLTRVMRQFQSTHPRGVRHESVEAMDAGYSFQSTHPRGVRLAVGERRIRLVRVSIHAPARGATRSKGCPLPNRTRFNPRTREGCDDSERTTLRNASKFQSTHPRGVRRVVCQDTARLVGVSIHAPARGATEHPNSR